MLNFKEEKRTVYEKEVIQSIDDFIGFIDRVYEKDLHSVYWGKLHFLSSNFGTMSEKICLEKLEKVLPISIIFDEYGRPSKYKSLS